MSTGFSPFSHSTIPGEHRRGELTQHTRGMAPFAETSNVLYSATAHSDPRSHLSEPIKMPSLYFGEPGRADLVAEREEGTVQYIRDDGRKAKQTLHA